MAKGKDPSLIRYAGGKWTIGHELVVPLHGPDLMGSFLRGNVTENTPFFECVVLLERSQFVDFPARDERRRGNL